MSNKANLINHFGLVIDASSSMFGRKDSVIQVADNQIAYWAKRSQELKQETRVSVWIFSSVGRNECVVWDMDVLRLPSIAKFYSPVGQTALIDATMDAIRDLKETPERYGDHSFLLYVITDGEENDSKYDDSVLARRSYYLVPVIPDGIAIKQFVEDCGWHFIIGNGYYELMKTESIQPQKEIAIVEKGRNGKVYVGDAARQLLNLPDMEVRVKPDYNPDYTVFVQSTSVNRKLRIGTKFLYLK